MRWFVVLCALSLIAAKKGKPLVIPKAKVAKATWPSAPPKQAATFALVAADQAQLLGRTVLGAADVLLVYTVADGVQGPIALPKGTVWAGTGRGAIYAATRDGALYRAPMLAAGRKDGLVKVAAVKGAGEWDAAGGRVIVAVGTRARVSSDGGDTFVDHDFAAPVKQVFARGDGVVVAVPEQSWAWVSSDGGRTWQAPPAGLDPAQQQKICTTRPARSDDTYADMLFDDCEYPRAPYFVRHGDRIAAHARDSRGSRDYNCVQGALAADGTTWVAPGEYPYPYADTPFDLGENMVGERVAIMAAPPPAGVTAVAETASCLKNPDAWFRSHPGGSAIDGGGGGPCRALSCLPRASPRPADGTHAFFRDGDCDFQTGTCKRTATRVSIGTRGEVVLSRAPCGSGLLDSQEGTAVLLCHAATGAAVQLGDRRGGWFEQEPLPIEYGRVDVGSDGTIVVAEHCRAGEACRAFVRAPAPLEARPPWTEVTLAGALAYRAAQGGRALAVTRATDGKALDLEVRIGRYGVGTAVDGSYYDAWTARSYGDHPLVPIVKACVADAVGRIGATSGVITVGVDLDANGALTSAPRVAGAPDEPAAACIADRAKPLTCRKPPRALSAEREVIFDAPALRFALWLADGAMSTRLLDNGDASQGVRDVWIDGSNVKVRLGDLDHRSASALVLTDGTLRPTK